MRPSIYIYVSVDIYYYTYGYTATLGSQGTKSVDLVWTIIHAQMYTVQKL